MVKITTVAAVPEPEVSTEDKAMKDFGKFDYEYEYVYEDGRVVPMDELSKLQVRAVVHYSVHTNSVVL